MPWTPDADTPTKVLARELLWAGLARLYDLEVAQDSEPMPVQRSYNGRMSTWGRGAMIDAIQVFCRLKGRVPTNQEWRTSTLYNLPSYATVYKEFKGIEGLYAAADVGGAESKPVAPRPAVRRRWKQ